jgi:uncharacterized protein (TIGR02270 family)
MIAGVIEQHAEEAAFLWHRRDVATDHPRYTLGDLGDLEERLEAHLDGLRVAGERGLEIAWAQLEQFGGAGELFTVMALTLESRADPCLERGLAFAEAAPRAWPGLFGAVGWVPAEMLRGRVVGWLDVSDPFRRLLGVAACSLHRADPRSRLERLLEDDPLVRRRAIRLAGELGRVDLRDRLRPSLAAEDEECRFWAAWSAALLGDRAAAIPILQELATGDGPFKWRAVDLVPRLMDREATMSWLRELGQDVAQSRLLVVAAGVFGDPVTVPWLIERMSEPVLARVAGDSFSTLTGVDLSAERLDRPAPVDLASGPTDDAADEDVAMDPDEGLPWPDPAKVQGWWQTHDTLGRGVRHLAGRPLAGESCLAILRAGNQSQRRAAAYELALGSGQPLRNWRARAVVQAAELGAAAAA